MKERIVRSELILVVGGLFEEGSSDPDLVPVLLLLV
jgi:hypothetical protein